MIDLRPDFYNRIPSWVKEDPRRLHLFLYLLDKADEDGYAEFSVLGYAKQAGLGREVVRRIMSNLEKRTIIESISNQHSTIVFICNLERYIVHPTNTQPTPNQQATNSEPLQKDKKETKVPPCTPFKEKKEKKENVAGVVASLQEKKEKPAQPENFSFSEPIEKRRERFWADICHSHALHRDWPVEGVKSFFLYWTQPSNDGQRMLFEEEAHFGITYRMRSYLKYGQWLTDLHDAKLQLIKSKQAASELERKRAKAAAEEASIVYDRAFEEMGRKRQKNI